MIRLLTILLVVLAMLSTAGCRQAERITPSHAKFKGRIIIIHGPTGLPVQTIMEPSSEAAGAGFEGTSAKDWKGGKAKADAKGAGVGASNMTWYQDLGTPAMKSVYIGGVIVCVLGALAAWGVGLKLGAMIGGCGIGLIMAGRFIEVYPWAPAIPGVLVVGAFVYWAYHSRAGRDARIGLRAMTSAVDEDAPDVARSSVYNGLGARAGDAAKRAWRAVERERKVMAKSMGKA